MWKYLSSIIFRRKKKKMTTYLEENFENFNNKGWFTQEVGTGIVQRSATQKASGVYSLHMSSVNDGMSTAFLRSANLLSIPAFSWHLGFKIYIVSQTTMEMVIDNLSSTETALDLFILPIGGSHFLAHGSTQQVKMLATLVWYKIDVYATGSLLTYYVDNISYGSFTQPKPVLCNDFYINLDNVANSLSGDFYIDDLIVDDSVPVTGKVDQTSASVANEFTRLRTVRHIITLAPMVIG